MRNKRFGLCAFICAVFLVCSCQSKPTVWDESYPEGSLTTLRMTNFTAESFNGIPVTKFYWVKIPAGETTLSGIAVINHAGVNFRLRDMEFTYDFKAGTEYIIQGVSQNMLWGIYVYEASKSSEMSAENRLAFIPFKNQPGSQ